MNQRVRKINVQRARERVIAKESKRVEIAPTIRTESVIPRAAEWMKDYYKDQDVFILGSGPSLKDFKFSRLEGKKVIAINHMHAYVNPDMLVFLDSSFRMAEVSRGVDFSQLPFKVVTGPSAGLKRGGNISTFHYAQKPEFSGIKFYGMANSALFALNVALYCNAKRIFLLGIDCCFHKGKSHFYSDHQKHPRDNQPEPYERTAKQFEFFSGFKNVFNLSAISTINCFPKMKLGEIL